MLSFKMNNPTLSYSQPTVFRAAGCSSPFHVVTYVHNSSASGNDSLSHCGQEIVIVIIVHVPALRLGVRQKSLHFWLAVCKAMTNFTQYPRMWQGLNLANSCELKFSYVQSPHIADRIYGKGQASSPANSLLVEFDFFLHLTFLRPFVWHV